MFTFLPSVSLSLKKILWHHHTFHIFQYISYEIKPIGSMYGIYANIWGILMVNVTIYGIHTDPMGNDIKCYIDPHGGFPRERRRWMSNFRRCSRRTARSKWKKRGRFPWPWGIPKSWWVYFMEHPNLNWMIFRGSPWKQESSTSMEVNKNQENHRKIADVLLPCSFLLECRLEMHPARRLYTYDA